jgi:hypothetical protein
MERATYVLNVRLRTPNGNYEEAGSPIELATPRDAFLASINILKNVIPNGDIFVFEATGDSTVVKEVTDESIQITIIPNILQENTRKIGPYSLRMGAFLRDLPEN